MQEFTQNDLVFNVCHVLGIRFFHLAKVIVIQGVQKITKIMVLVHVFSSCEGDRYPGVPKKVAQRAASGPPCPAGVI